MWDGLTEEQLTELERLSLEDDREMCAFILKDSDNTLRIVPFSEKCYVYRSAGGFELDPIQIALFLQDHWKDPKKGDSVTTLGVHMIHHCHPIGAVPSGTDLANMPIYKVDWIIFSSATGEFALYTWQGIRKWKKEARKDFSSHRKYAWQY